MMKDEIIIREMIRDESEAVAHYTKAIFETANPKVKAVLEDIRKEEMVHLGELRTVLNDVLLINDEVREREGAEEATETIEKVSVMNRAHDLLHDFRHNPVFDFKRKF